MLSQRLESDEEACFFFDEGLFFLLQEVLWLFALSLSIVKQTLSEAWRSSWRRDDMLSYKQLSCESQSGKDFFMERERNARVRPSEEFSFHEKMPGLANFISVRQRPLLFK
jgi:hypothetical protein